MGKFTVGKASHQVGSVVLVNFPFSNLKGQKLRPALVVAIVEFKNLILCQITSKSYSSKISIELYPHDFSDKGLSIVSYVRPDKIFTADPTIVKSAIGQLTLQKKKEILGDIRTLFT